MSDPPVSEITDFRSESAHLNANTHDRDTIRRHLGYRILWLIAVIALGLLGGVLLGRLELAEAKDLADAILSPLLGVFATIVGFFFGYESRRG